MDKKARETHAAAAILLITEARIQSDWSSGHRVSSRIVVLDDDIYIYCFLNKINSLDSTKERKRKR